MISVVLVTYNRKHLLEQCIQKVLSRVSPMTRQIVIWNNASTDGSHKILETITDPRVLIIHNEKNIGTNAFARAFKRASEDYLIELDDDVIDAPQDWDKTMLEAFQRIPSAGFLAANVVDDGKSTAAEIFYRRDCHLYAREQINGVELLVGPTGGWCTITSRKIYDQVGGFQENPNFVYWHEDGAYVKAVERSGYRAAILASLKVFHAAGPAYSEDPQRRQEKEKFDNWRLRRATRRNSIKRFLNRIPPCRWLNSRFKFYRLPDRDPV